MLDPSKRFITLVLVLGTAVLLLAIAVGEGMGDRVLGSATERRLGGLPSIVITPAPSQTNGPLGPNWQRTQSLAAAPDPGFPDPRVPPQPLPTVAPRPSPSPRSAAPAAAATINPAIPIWRQKPLPTTSPAGATPAATPTPAATETPVPGPSVAPPNS